MISVLAGSGLPAPSIAVVRWKPPVARTLKVLAPLERKSYGLASAQT